MSNERIDDQQQLVHGNSDRASRRLDKIYRRAWKAGVWIWRSHSDSGITIEVAINPKTTAYKYRLDGSLYEDDDLDF
jgi:hypothetical protein